MKAIGSDSFDQANIQHINIPEGVVSIGDGAFGDIRVSNLIFPSTVKYNGFYLIGPGVESVTYKASADGNQVITLPASAGEDIDKPFKTYKAPINATYISNKSGSSFYLYNNNIDIYLYGDTELSTPNLINNLTIPSDMFSNVANVHVVKDWDVN